MMEYTEEEWAKEKNKSMMCSWEDKIRCPHCGYQMDLDDEDGFCNETECGRCGKWFFFDVEYNPSISSYVSESEGK